jgi:hypothetical protein
MTKGTADGLVTSCLEQEPKSIDQKLNNILLLDAFEVCVTRDIRSVIPAVNTDLMIVSGGTASQLHILVTKTLRIILNNCILNSSWQGTTF